MHDQAHTLKPPQPIFRKTVSIDIQSPLSQDQKEQFFKESKLTVSFSSPPNSGRDNCIPDEEVISYFIPDDNYSQTSYKQVRFSEPQEKTTNTIGYKYRRQRSIPIPEKVQEDLIGESSQLSPYNKSQIRIKERQHMNQSTNLLHDNENQFGINAIQLENSFGWKTISSNDYSDQIIQMADELVNLVKNYLNNISFHESHFTFDEREVDNRNRLQLQRRVLQKALENLNLKLNSPITRISNTSSCLEDYNVDYKELQLKIEELTDQNDILKDKLEIQDLKLLQQYEEVKEQQIQLVDLELKNKSFQLDLDSKQQEIVTLNQQLLQLKKQLDEQIKICQIQSQKIQQLEQQQMIEKQSNSFYYTSKINTNNLNKSFKKEKKHTNSFHEVCSSPNGKKIMIVNSSTNSSQQSPRNLQISNSKILNLDDTTYFGSVYNEKRQGYGNLKKGDKKLYMGFWKDDTFNGFGHLNNETVDFGIIDYRNLDSVGNKWFSYQGEFQDGLFHGYGIWTFSDNSRFHGVFQLGKACGRGAYYTNINTIQGIWNKNIKM
ncbi:unnamed protein product [Paramecium pentaurelia]|uniref:Uncharacterized protein n=1 Tax=Paramecium pentaurelia TaxID=43138 RepID=A0A8S1Y0Y2_9CILI|nr:unnamed protein product [Paramecium pentaurelia]